MSDVVVTLPKRFGLEAWIAEGDPAGAPWSGEEWHFYLGGSRPRIEPGERVYVVYDGRLIGYSLLVRIETTPTGFALVRHGGAVAVTIDEHIKGFRGFQYRWWHPAEEIPCPDWKRDRFTAARGRS